MPHHSPTLALVLAAALSLAVAAKAEDETDLPLPRWLPQELDAMRANPNLPPVLGSLLGGLEEMGDAPTPTPVLLGEDTADLVDSPDKSQPSTDLSRFLPQALLAGPRSHPRQQSTAPLKDVPRSFLEACEKAPLESHLVDPNHELSETTVEDLERFLTFHATDSHIPLRLILLGKSQKLPDDVSIAAITGGHISKGSSALLVCPYGEPWRSRLFVSEAIRTSVSANTLNDLLDNGVREAMRASDPAEQLHQMLVHMSIRLFWIQRTLTPQDPIAIPGQVTSAAANPIPMAEVRSVAARPALPVKAVPLFAIVAAGSLLVIVLGYGAWRWRRFKMRHYEWILPPSGSATSHRFGGPHCGGGAAIHFR